MNGLRNQHSRSWARGIEWRAARGWSRPPLKREALARRSIGQLTPQARRYRKRSTVERVNGRLKDEFGGRHVRVRGYAKVLCPLMLGIVALLVDQLMRLTL